MYTLLPQGEAQTWPRSTELWGAVTMAVWRSVGVNSATISVIAARLTPARSTLRQRPDPARRLRRKWTRSIDKTMAPTTKPIFDTVMLLSSQAQDARPSNTKTPGILQIPTLAMLVLGLAESFWFTPSQTRTWSPHPEAFPAMNGRYFLLSVAGLSVLQYFLLTGIRAERIVTDTAERMAREATRSFSQLVDLISESRSGLYSSFALEDVEPLAAPPLELEDGDASTLLFANDEYLSALIEHYGEYYQVDPVLVRLIIEQESAFDPLAFSPAGAMGLMQLMPDTAWLLGVSDPFDPEQNIEAGVRYFAQQMDRFGSLELALAAYNAGPGAVESWGGVPPYPETVNYVNSIMGRYMAESMPAIDPALEQAVEAAEQADLYLDGADATGQLQLETGAPQEPALGPDPELSQPQD
jgi:hypothetical protein